MRSAFSLVIILLRRALSFFVRRLNLFSVPLATTEREKISSDAWEKQLAETKNDARGRLPSVLVGVSRGADTGLSRPGARVVSIFAASTATACWHGFYPSSCQP